VNKSMSCFESLHQQMAQLRRKVCQIVGGVISPLLSNLYMRRFILWWKQRDLERTLGARIVNYADDLVILCRTGGADKALAALREMMNRLKLTVNEDKTRLCRMPDGQFDFLGYTFGRYYSPKTGRSSLCMYPSRKSIKRLTAAIGETTNRRTFGWEATEMVGRLNRMLTGWANYFCLGPVGKPYRFVDIYTAARLRRWLCQKHKVQNGGFKRYPDRYLYQHLRLEHLQKRPQSWTWAKV
jgi:RNA-directed DNA polymerase